MCGYILGSSIGNKHTVGTRLASPVALTGAVQVIYIQHADSLLLQDVPYMVP